jgi:hypothetical protein
LMSSTAKYKSDAAESKAERAGFGGSEAARTRVFPFLF